MSAYMVNGLTPLAAMNAPKTTGAARMATSQLSQGLRPVRGLTNGAVTNVVILPLPT